MSIRYLFGVLQSCSSKRKNTFAGYSSILAIWEKCSGLIESCEQGQQYGNRSFFSWFNWRNRLTRVLKERWTHSGLRYFQTFWHLSATAARYWHPLHRTWRPARFFPSVIRELTDDTTVRSIMMSRNVRERMSRLRSLICLRAAACPEPNDIGKGFYGEKQASHSISAIHNILHAW